MAKVLLVFCLLLALTLGMASAARVLVYGGYGRGYGDIGSMGGGGGGQVSSPWYNGGWGSGSGVGVGRGGVGGGGGGYVYGGAGPALQGGRGSGGGGAGRP